MAREIIQVVYARKPIDWHEIESGSRPDCGEAIPTQVSETREMTEAEYNAFIARPLAKREWLAGKGGYQGNIKQAIALVCTGRETLYIDPSGSDYGRYVGRAVVVDKEQRNEHYNDQSPNLTNTIMTIERNN